MQIVGEEAVLDPTEQVVNGLHDSLVGQGMDAGRAARDIRRSLAVRARAVRLSEEFWGWLGC